jgi:hypothetical protein
VPKGSLLKKKKLKKKKDGGWNYFTAVILTNYFQMELKGI